MAFRRNLAFGICACLATPPRLRRYSRIISQDHLLPLVPSSARPLELSSHLLLKPSCSYQTFLTRSIQISQHAPVSPQSNSTTYPRVTSQSQSQDYTHSDSSRRPKRLRFTGNFESCCVLSSPSLLSCFLSTTSDDLLQFCHCKRTDSTLSPSLLPPHQEWVSFLHPLSLFSH